MGTSPAHSTFAENVERSILLVFWAILIPNTGYIFSELCGDQAVVE